MNHWRAVRVPIMMIRGIRPFHIPAAKTHISQNRIGKTVMPVVSSRRIVVVILKRHQGSKHNIPNILVFFYKGRSRTEIYQWNHKKSWNITRIIPRNFLIRLTHESKTLGDLYEVAALVLVEFGHDGISRMRYNGAEHTSWNTNDYSDQ